MTRTRAQRRLAAILAADVVGYSRLMGADEEGTRARFNALLESLFEPAIAQHHGRVVKTMGDGLLVEFSSAIDAVRCAFGLQQALAGGAAEARDGPPLVFRMGVNLGDVIVEGDDIHGDGVNVAARLEALAEPGTVVVSGIVHDVVRTRVEVAFADLGRRRVKNIAEPVHAYRLRATGDADAVDDPAGSAAEVSRPRTDRPSLAVLPLANQGGDPQQEYFADGLTEDLITDLLHVPGLHVAARNSSFACKGRAVDTGEVARRLGVRHVLAGSVRRAGGRVRINLRLVDAEAAAEVWAERYDGDFDDIFTLQDTITAQVVQALPRLLEPLAAQPGRARPARDPEAYDLVLRGRSEYYLFTPGHMARAIGYFEQAIARDPGYAEAHAYLAYCLCTSYVFAWPGAAKTLDAALGLAEQAIALDDRSAVAHARRGWILAYLDRADECIASFDRAVALAPRNAEVCYAYGESMNRLCRPRRALPLLEKAFAIDTLVPPPWEFAKGHSFVLVERYAPAFAHLGTVVERVPGFVPARVQLARACVETGQVAEGEALVASIREIAPRYTLASAMRMFPYPDAVQRERLVDGLRRAGLPE